MIAAAGPPRVRPSGWWYLATVGIFVLGALVAAGLVIGGFRSARRVADEITSIEPGGSGPVTFEEPGSFTLYYAGPEQATTIADVRRLQADAEPELRPSGGGAAILLRPYESTVGIIDADEEGNQVVAMSTFTVTRAGDYTLTVDEIEGVSPMLARVIVGKSFYAPLARGAIAAVVALGVGALFSLVATIALAVTRGRAKRARPPGPPSWPPAPGPFAGPSGPTPPILLPRPPPGYGPPDSR